MTATEKYCTSCGIVKPAEAFGIRRRSPDGLQIQCKECRYTRAADSEFRRRRTDQEFRERERAQSRAKGRRARQKNPDAIVSRDAERLLVGTKQWARKQLLNARQRGDLVKPDACERCGAVPDPRHLHGHHWHGDYANRPLEVEWLCSLCHGAERCIRVAA